MCVRKRLLTGEIRSANVIKKVRISPDSNAIRLVDCISPSHTLVFELVSDGKHMGSVSQRKLLDEVLKNPMITAEECCNHICIEKVGKI